MGSTILFDALRSGNTVDVYVDYTGTIWATLMKRDEPIPTHAKCSSRSSHFLKQEHGVLTVGATGVRERLLPRDEQEAARPQLGIRSIARPRRATPDDITVGGDPEVFGRSEWKRVRDAYEPRATSRTRGMDSTFMYDAVRDGEVDVITAYSSDGRIAAYDLLVLKDPKQAFPPYDAMLLVGPEAMELPGLLDALRPLVNQISDEEMREANRLVDLEKKNPTEAAEYLSKAR